MTLDELDRRLRSGAGVRVLEAQDDLFYLYDPAGNLPPERQQPFATIVTGDHYEQVSRLGEPGAWRLNLGLTKATYTALFGAPPTERDADWVLDSGHDYAARDVLMPHPFYAAQYWVAIVSPTAVDAALLTEAYEFAARKYANQQARHTV
ncbi:hypothetical protein HPO96_10380 [Kribbella sandramycini]|uniref:DUF6194 domain-containing protein n=1 Tax=Kribbella sandramycini TaxID=60450 RepID=A0A7Y4KZQ5_9ACTN|nr:DUF6194 family protein [Kribbella sandramycini]MBB6569515.1 hypothetical protein [Kribbella sandramycini]NOL40651.1 hypothetical protein [Kribbella sandramycini]